MSTMGIYKIENDSNGKLYIGSSRNIESRWIQHKNMLNNNKHHSAHLQYAWNFYGGDKFRFEIIEEVSNQSEILVREQSYIDEFNSYDENFGYNICGIAGKTNEYKNDNRKYKKLNNEYLTERSKYKYVFEDNEQERQFIPSNDSNDDIFSRLIRGLYNFYTLGLINSGEFTDIILFTKSKHINVYNFQDLSIDEFDQIVQKNYFELIKLDNFRYGMSLDVRRDDLKWYGFDYDKDLRTCKLYVQTKYGTSSFVLAYAE